MSIKSPPRPQLLTLNECCDVLRANLIPISNTTLAAGLKDRRFPFGDAVQTGKSWVYLIYRRSLTDWLRDHVEEGSYVEP